jgi:hypothetical protein
MWKPEIATEQYVQRLRWFEKKRERELRQVLKNLATYLEALRAGTKPMQIRFGWVHPEPQDVYAITQGGGSRNNLAETRLYVLPMVSQSILWQLLIGDKQGQSSDIDFCKRCAIQIKEEATRGNAADHP